VRSADDDSLWESFDENRVISEKPELDKDDLEELAMEYADADDYDEDGELPNNFLDSIPHEAIMQAKWKAIRQPLLPDVADFDPKKVDYTCKQSLRDKFKDTGLQIVVKMASIELTPEKPEFPAGGWHVSLHVIPPTILYLRVAPQQREPVLIMCRSKVK